MDDLPVVAIKMLNGGIFVVAFALVAEVLSPKRFAGLFSAAPSIALANLLVVLLTKGRGQALANLSGMIVGALAMAAVCVLGVWLVPRVRSKKASVAMCCGWFVFALAGWWLLP